jgi:predicted Zn-dependent protease with MMP-like domain
VREGADPLPPEILIFLVNIMDEAEGDWDRFRQEVRTTLLHEIGHYLGLDEEGLFERELE